MRAVLSILFATAAFGPSVASADQCQLVDAQVAARAVELARKSTSVIDWCEPCRGSNKRGPFTINTVEHKNRQIEINGIAVDLAYTFIHTKGDEYTNLGLAAGCQAHGVSRTIQSSQPAQRPPPPPPPRGPFPPRTPAARVTSGDDVGGTWSVSIRGVVSTCTTMPAHRKATWTIAVSDGKLSLITEAGREMVAAVPTLDRQSIRVDLQDRQRPDAAVLQVNQSLKDHFFAKLLHVDRAGRTQGCATLFDVMATRVP